MFGRRPERTATVERLQVVGLALGETLKYDTKLDWRVQFRFVDPNLVQFTLLEGARDRSDNRLLAAVIESQSIVSSVTKLPRIPTIHPEVVDITSLPVWQAAILPGHSEFDSFAALHDVAASIVAPRGVVLVSEYVPGWSSGIAGRA